MYGQVNSAMIPVTSGNPGWSNPPKHPCSDDEHTVESPTANSRSGSDSQTSMTPRDRACRASLRGSRPTRPTTMPINVARLVPTTETKSDVRAP